MNNANTSTNLDAPNFSSEVGESGLSEDQQDLRDQEDAKAAPEPNIVFVGEGEPTTKINNGMETIKLPNAEIQEKPFFHKQAGVIIQLFPGDYKRFVKKGQ